MKDKFSAVTAAIVEAQGGGGGGSGDVTGVKGAAESTYRKGNVTLTPENLGLQSEVKVTGTVSGNTVSFTHANVPTGAIEDPWIDGIEERIINKSISGNTITYTFADNAADGKSAYIYIRG